MAASQETEKQDSPTLSRRGFLSMAGGLAATAAADMGGLSEAIAAPATKKSPRANKGKAPNILFVFTDQERYLSELPLGYRLPGHDRLKQKGVTFHNHYCPAVMCTSSRAVLMTGLQTADNRMFENTDMPYVKPMSKQIPTIGHMLRGAGYYTAYKGKWHLNVDYEKRDRSLNKEMDEYGFSDFELPVDSLAHALGGYKHDEMIASEAIGWLRDKGQTLHREGKPWSMVVSLVNPHDIMYFNTDAPGQAVQDNGRLMMGAARAPEHAMYRKRWNAKLPASLSQSLNEPGRPKAHFEFDRSWGYSLGSIPLEAERWQRFSDFYLNSLRCIDQQLVRLLDELDALGLADDTVVVFTSDHGEMGGAHGLRGKGPMAYQEVMHLPLYIVHPDVKGGQDCYALTGHIDLLPTLMSIAGVDSKRTEELAGRKLPGKDASVLLNDPGKADVNAIRESVLYTYSGLATNDSELIRHISEARADGKNPKEAVKLAGYRPNLKKRGSLRTAFDGRYKFTRYFSPLERHSPKSIDELYRWNDVELFDLKSDPREMVNLGADRVRNEALILAMNAKLERVIASEIGVDDGREMPNMEDIDWVVDRIDL